MSSTSLPSGFLKTTLANGIGRYVCQLKRVTFRFCKEQHGSLGMREFIENQFIDFARKNPSVVVYAEVKRHKLPSLVAEYVNGKTHKLSMANKDQFEIAEWLDWLRTRSGDDLIRLKKPQHTHSPSIQGTWTPMTNRDFSLNTTKFPDIDLSAARKFKPSTTEVLKKAANDFKKFS